MSVASSSQNPMWANAMREVLTMVGDATDEASRLIRTEAEEKLEIFLGWLDGTLPKPSDEDRQRLVREVTVLYRRARAASGTQSPASRRVPLPAPDAQEPAEAAPAPADRHSVP